MRTHSNASLTDSRSAITRMSVFGRVERIATMAVIGLPGKSLASTHSGGCSASARSIMAAASLASPHTENPFSARQRLRATRMSGRGSPRTTGIAVSTRRPWLRSTVAPWSCGRLPG